MTRETPTTRDRLIDATVTLLRAKGAAASGTKEILELADAPRGSFYFHFPGGKDELVLFALRRAAAATLSALEAALADEDGDVSAQINDVFEGIAADLTDHDFAPGCAVAVTTAESASLDQRFREAAAHEFAAWTSTLASRLHASGTSLQDAEMFADAIVAAMEGATILARAKHDTAPLAHASLVLRMALRANNANPT